jgi:hypothetical protein
VAITSATASSIAAYAAIAAAVAGTAGAVVQGVSDYEQGKFAEAEANINRAQALQSQKQAHQEESLNSSQHYRMVRHEIAEGQNVMSASGNIGTSAESALRGAYFNLSEDVSALKYKYGAEAAVYGTQANMYAQHAKMARRNRRVGVLGSALNVTATAARGVTDLYSAGILGSSKSPSVLNEKPGKVTGYKGAVSNSGMYGAYDYL